jgi:predicted secreted Zn-dependent protease
LATAAGLLLICGMTASAAKPRVSVDYQYYPVNGTTVLQLLRALHLHGPTVNGEGAYAATMITDFRQGGTPIAGASCRIPDYTQFLRFTIILPAARDVPQASSRVRAAWRSFYAFVKRHEETHKSIWVGCAARMEARVRALKAPTCDAFAARATQILSQETVACSRKHDAFDRAERVRLRAQPLIRQALRAAGD